MKNAMESVLKHPIASAIVISATLGGVANIVREVKNLCETFKSKK